MVFRQRYCGRSGCLLAVVVLATCSAMTAQEAPKPKVDVMLGYSWLHPDVTVNTVPLTDNDKGGAAAITLNLTRHFGVTFDGAIHKNTNNESGSAMAGPRIIWRGEHFQPFLQALGGGRYLTLTGLSGRNWKIGAMGGGGLDIALGRVVSFRLAQASYVWSRHDFPFLTGELSAPGVELRTGIVFKFGGGGGGRRREPRAPTFMSATCSEAQPASVLAGEPVVVAMTVTNLPPKHTVSYKWKTTGGEITPKGNAATVITNGLAPGNYTVTGTATDPKPRKGEGPASCTAMFTVNEPAKNAPSIACTVRPAKLRPGEQATISCTTRNPDERPLNYSYTASAGRIVGTGPSATFNSAGAPPGPITITATVTDDRGLSANTSAIASVEAPPAAPQASRLDQITFADRRLPARVDNVAKAILDDISLRLQREPDAKAVIVGYADSTEPNALRMAQQRAVNTKQYLTQEKGIDPSRIEVRTGTAGGGKRAEIYFVPPGASFNLPGTDAFDESQIKAQPRSVGPVRRRSPIRR